MFAQDLVVENDDFDEDPFEEVGGVHIIACMHMPGSRPSRSDTVRESMSPFDMISPLPYMLARQWQSGLCPLLCAIVWQRV
jgi:hypothetical protein